MGYGDVGERVMLWAFCRHCSTLHVGVAGAALYCLCQPPGKKRRKPIPAKTGQLKVDDHYSHPQVTAECARHVATVARNAARKDRT